MKVKPIPLNVVLFSGFLLVALYCAAFTVMHDNIILNRYTDSWWHIAVAEEYAETGVFAKDPFFEDVPSFAQFGLMEFVNAHLSKMTGVSTREIWPWLVGWNVFIAAMASFLAGFLINRKVMHGVVSGFAWMLIYGRHTIIGVGMPFAAAIPLLFLLMVMLWNGTRISDESIPVSALKGVLLGILFDLHVFVGLVGCLVVAAAFLGEMITNRRKDELLRLVVRGAVVAALFIALAWRWILMHIRLRPFLDAVNAHNNTEYGVEKPFIIALILGLLLLGVTLLHERDKRRLLAPLMVFSSLLALGCIPAINAVVLEHTSWYMARRLPLLFPFGIVFVFAWDGVINLGGAMTGRILHRDKSKLGALRTAGCVATTILALAVLLPSAKTWALFHLYMHRTDAFDQHKFAFIERDLAGAVEGETVLSDPTASYYLRGMAGARVMTMIPGEGSPAIDYVERDRIARAALQQGPEALVNAGVTAVVLCTNGSSTSKFAGKPIEEIVAVWKSQGWVIARTTENLILLRRGESS